MYPCPFCQNHISISATFCPHCNKNIPSSKATASDNGSETIYGIPMMSFSFPEPQTEEPPLQEIPFEDIPFEESPESQSISTARASQDPTASPSLPMPIAPQSIWQKIIDWWKSIFVQN